MHKLLRSQVFLELQTVLKQHQIPYEILGGFARDVHYDAEPNDVDVVVYLPQDNEESHHKTLQLAMSLGDRGFTATGNKEYASSNDLSYVFQKDDVDLLVLNKIDDGTAHFDCNLNQFKYHEQTGETIYVGTIGTFGKLTWLKDDLTDERKAKMKALATKYGWIT